MPNEFGVHENEGGSFNLNGVGSFEDILRDAENASVTEEDDFDPTLGFGFNGDSDANVNETVEEQIDDDEVVEDLEYTQETINDESTSVDGKEEVSDFDEYVNSSFDTDFDFNSAQDVEVVDNEFNSNSEIVEQVDVITESSGFNAPEKTSVIKNSAVSEVAPESVVDKEVPSVPTPVSHLSVDTSRNGLQINDKVGFIGAVVATSDAIRSLPEDSVKAVNIFITDGSPVSTHTDLVLAALSANLDTLEIVQAIVEAKQKEAVDMAFYILALSEPILKGVGNFISNDFSTDVKVIYNGDKLSYARELVNAIQGLTNESIERFNAVKLVLEAGRKDFARN